MTPARSLREYLADLQRRAQDEGPARRYDAHIEAEYLSTLEQCSTEDRERMEENLRTRKECLAKYEALLPTPFQSVQDFARLQDAKAAIDRELERVGEYPPRSNLVLGSAELASFNAYSGYWRATDEHLIVFNRALLAALLATSNFLACVTKIDHGTVGGPTKLDVDEAVIDRVAMRYADLLDVVVAGGVPQSDQLITLWAVHPEREAFWTMWEDAGTEFILAHEYAHVLLGHNTAAEDITADNGGWGAEYEADSVALDLVAQRWVERAAGDTAHALVVLQGVTMFFCFVSHLEQWSVEGRGDTACLWDTSQSHPPTRVRWVRMLEKAGTRLGAAWGRAALEDAWRIERVMRRLFELEAAKRAILSPVGLEWEFQRAAFSTMVERKLLPQHLYLALRCAASALKAGAPIDGVSLTTKLKSADAELREAGARPLLDYLASGGGYEGMGPLHDITQGLSIGAVRLGERLGNDHCVEVVERLVRVALADARCRYPAQL